MDALQSYKIEPIGIIHSCFTEKFGIPRQPGLVKSAVATLELLQPYNREEMVRGLESFSHIWVQFLFHETIAEGWRPTIRPPWLGGKKRMGVFSTRSPHRPNHLGLSVVRLEGIELKAGHPVLELSGVDLLNGTPVVDIKPYTPYCDKIDTATASYADGEIPDSTVLFTDHSKLFCASYFRETDRNLEKLICEVIRHDPRPASQKGSRSEFGMTLWDVNIRWIVEPDGTFIVQRCDRLYQSS